MAKYDSIRDELRRSGEPRITLTFQQIENIVPGGLPKSAYDYGAWWAHEREPQQVQKLAWLEAGYRVERADRTARTVTFTRLR